MCITNPTQMLLLPTMVHISKCIMIVQRANMQNNLLNLDKPPNHYTVIVITLDDTRTLQHNIPDAKGRQLDRDGDISVECYHINYPQHQLVSDRSLHGTLVTDYLSFHLTHRTLNQLCLSY